MSQERDNGRFAVYVQALTHSTWAYENGGQDNERLEFLGDAVLQLAVSDLLYERFPDDPEGELSRIRRLVVSNDNLGRLAQQLGLEELLRFGKGKDRPTPKVLAGAWEALLGAVYLDQGFGAATLVVRAVMGPVLEKVRCRRNPKDVLMHWCQARDGTTPSYETVDATGPAHQRVFRVVALIQGKVVGEGTGTSKKRAETEAAAAAVEQLGLK